MYIRISLDKNLEGPKNYDCHVVPIITIDHSGMILVGDGLSLLTAATRREYEGITDP